MSIKSKKSALTRRQFITASAGVLSAAGTALTCPAFAITPAAPVFNFEISLAQWSLHKAFFSGELSALDFPVIAREKYDIGAVEYVNQFFMDKAQDKKFLGELNRRAQDHNVVNSLIMIDGEPELSSQEKSVRAAAVEGHKKWIEAAKFLQCSSIRVNLHGQGTEQEWHAHSVESLRALCNFSRDFDIKILVENHGGFSSSGKLLAAVMQAVDDPLCGTMPDFGNFCIRRRDGDMWQSPCVDQYDIYTGVAELMPYAGAVSAKSFDFNAEGNEVGIDFRAMLQLVKAAKYNGYVGIEYEGNSLSEDAGIRATKALLVRLREELA